MARSIASCTIGFGIVSIPVKIYLATSSETGGHFNFINPDTGNRVNQFWRDAVTGAEVNRSTFIRGKQVGEEIVTFTNEEYNALAEPKNVNLDIDKFVPMESLDELRVEQTLFAIPDKGAAKAYRLLERAISELNVFAVGEWTTRGKTHLVAIRSIKGNLVIHKLHFDNEVRECPKYDNASLSEEEASLALQLVQANTGASFDTSTYCDRFSERVDAAVQAKLSGPNTVPAVPVKMKQAKSLADLLRESLNK